MDEPIKERLESLGLKILSRDWNDVISEARKKQPSYHRFLTDIIRKEYFDKKENVRLF